MVDKLTRFWQRHCCCWLNQVMCVCVCVCVCGCVYVCMCLGVWVCDERKGCRQFLISSPRLIGLLQYSATRVDDGKASFYGTILTRKPSVCRCSLTYSCVGTCGSLAGRDSVLGIESLAPRTTVSLCMRMCVRAW